MSNVTFDTLTASKNLQDAGIEPKHAEAIALVIKDSQGVKDSQGELATKQDVQLVKQDIQLLKSDIKQLITELKTDIQQLKTELKTEITWIKCLIVAMMAVMLGGFSFIA